ncbi:putative 3-demethylubiquinone-9 3-methyltransferase (glyoxalase superfamily) [Sphingobium sp. B2D3A]|uniref:VOC family protein n=1 Tax=unclassified Sphingobium TaxID=2611147 RepID=UPI002224FD18|nr:MULTISPECIES: VOC family protein [unclassified Sphingobium]MCW2336301.1 putative 3-demethylubiquinone-9 3-methyltransferase (glyoxalase superfamily) [Sphingobium sp. B2D3A]MCW2386056.1 putative 3-demethylubiquinone-9 3-methyltransferase (glyoxalase superfamily) [Sphingobium sp. B2D3D]
MTSAITPCIWMDGTAEEAATFYVSLFPDSRIDRIVRYVDDSPFPPSFPAGTAMLVLFTLGGRPFSALNGGPMFPQTEAVSFVIPVDDQAELDRVWTELIADGGAESMCGWCKDRFGVSWQVVPRRALEMQASDDADAVRRMSSALMTMHKIDIATLETAFSGD